MDVKQLSSLPFRLSLTSWGFPCGFYKLKTEIRQGRVAESFVCVTSKSLSYMTWKHNFAGCLLLPFTLCTIQCPSFSKLLLLEQKRTLKYQFNRLTSIYLVSYLHFAGSNTPIMIICLAKYVQFIINFCVVFCQLRMIKYAPVLICFGYVT